MSLEIEKLKNGDLAEAINHGDPNHYIKLICEAATERDKDKRLVIYAALGYAICENYMLHVDAFETEQDRTNFESRLWGDKPESKGGIAA